MDEPGEVGGRSRVRDRCGEPSVDATGEAVAALCRHDGILREAALPAVVAEAVGPHPLPHIKGRPGTSGDDGPDHVASHHEGKGNAGRVAPRTDQRVYRVRGDQFGGHQHVGRTRDGHTELADHDLLYGSEPLHVGGAHRLC